jgi:hypothetical protein
LLNILKLDSGVRTYYIYGCCTDASSDFILHVVIAVTPTPTSQPPPAAGGGPGKNKIYLSAYPHVAEMNRSNCSPDCKLGKSMVPGARHKQQV